MVESILVVVVAFSFILFAGFVLSYLIYTNFLQPGPVYYPSKDEVVEKMLDLGKVKKGVRVLDLGSGDGRILVAAGRRGARAVGYEIDPILVYESRKRIEKEGLSDLCKVYLKSMWKADFRGVDVVVMYLFPKYMGRFEKIIEEKGRKGLVVVSNDYQFPGRKYDKKVGKIFVYKF